MFKVQNEYLAAYLVYLGYKVTPEKPEAAGEKVTYAFPELNDEKAREVLANYPNSEFCRYADAMHLVKMLRRLAG